MQTQQVKSGSSTRCIAAPSSRSAERSSAATVLAGICGRGISLRIQGAVLAVVAALLAPCAFGQVRPLQPGRVLDANPQVGFGGYNQARPLWSRPDANLIVTGNITGGRAFRGYSPVRSSSELFTSVPSASLSDFVRDSVGLPGIGMGLYRPRPYLYPSLAVTSPTGVAVRSGLRSAGTPTLGAASEAATLGAAIPQMTVHRRIFESETVVPGQQYLPSEAGVPARPGQLLGVPSLAGRALEVPPVTGEQVGRPQIPSPAEAEQAEMPAQPAEALPPESPLTRIIEHRPVGPALAGPAAEQPSVPTVGQQAVPSAAAQVPVPAQPTGLLARMQRLASLLHEPEQFARAAGIRPEDDPRLKKPGLSEAERQRLLVEVRRELAARLIQQRLAEPIRTLASTGVPEADAYLSRAEQYMRQKRFYLAAQAYDAALSLQPGNFLALVGKANALIGAGEHLSAYLALEAALRRFPELLVFNFDLPGLLGGHETVDLRRAELERLLKVKPDYRLRFLLGYLEYYSGLRDLGVQTLKRAAAEAPPEAPLRRAVQTLASLQSAGTGSSAGR